MLSVKLPILGFKFTQIYECSKNNEQCTQREYKFEGFDYCNKNKTFLEYCKNQIRLKDIIFLIGSDKQSKQSYRALRMKDNDLELIEDRDMPFGWPANTLLDDKCFLKIQSDKESVIGIAYNRIRYELV